MPRLGRAGGGWRSERLERAHALRRQTSLAGEILDRLPGELRRLGVRVLPPVDRGHGHRDLVGELFLRHAKLLAEGPDQTAGAVSHAPDPSNRRATGHAPARKAPRSERSSGAPKSGRVARGTSVARVGGMADS